MGSDPTADAGGGPDAAGAYPLNINLGPNIKFVGGK
jgi:hypothetical protein